MQVNRIPIRPPPIGHGDTAEASKAGDSRDASDLKHTPEPSQSKNAAEVGKTGNVRDASEPVRTPDNNYSEIAAEASKVAKSPDTGDILLHFGQEPPRFNMELVNNSGPSKGHSGTGGITRKITTNRQKWENLLKEADSLVEGCPGFPSVDEPSPFVTDEKAKLVGLTNKSGHAGSLPPQNATTNPEGSRVRPETRKLLPTLDQMQNFADALMREEAPPQRASYMDNGIMNRISCPTCHKGETTLVSLHVHQVLSGHCYCKECRAFFLGEATRNKHFDEVHSFTCRECSSVFNTLDKLREHQQTDEHCYCKACKCFFPREGDAVRHRLSYHLYPCGVCTEMFGDGESLEEHQKATKHVLTCGTCDVTFRSMDDMAEHLELAQRACECSGCKDGFETEAQLFEHQTAASHLYCKACEKAFASDKAVAEHIANVTHYSIMCGKCNRHFLSQDALAIHKTYRQHCEVQAIHVGWEEI